MELRLLGPVEAVVGGGSCTVAGAGERAVLALLLLSRGRVVASETLFDALWGRDLPTNPANALQVRVSKLRRQLAALGAENLTLSSRPPGYVLDVDPERVDAHRFTRLLTDARRAGAVDPQRAVGLYRAALDLWRGPALAEFTGEAWAQPDRARLEGLRDAATEELFDLQLAGDIATDLVTDIELAVARRPLQERLYGQLMLALYRAGRQADALGVYQRARDTLRQELGLDPSAALRRIEQAVLRQDPTLDARRSVAGGGRPPLRARLTSFVGRESELDLLRNLTAAHRLVTLTGPGGVGKTSLAVELARGVQASALDVWLVRLAGVADGDRDGVARAVTDALGLRDDPSASADRQLLTYLRDRAGLLVLDNCEHVADSCAVLVEEILGACPRMRLLATSREPIAAAGETQCAIAPLDTPPAEQSGDDLSAFAAVRLFLDRAGSVYPRFVPDRAAIRGIAEICRRLDGIPLGIELAAAGVKALPVEEIVARLGHSFPDLDAGPRTADSRHRTLRATVDWSHRLLTAAEQTLLRRLSVFRGGWSLEAAEQVAGTDPLEPADIVGLLAHLVDRSLVVADHGIGPRFHLLETLRHYAAERLAESGEANCVAAAHTAYFTDRARAGEIGLRGPGQRHWLAWQTTERDNLNAALTWCGEHQDHAADRRLALVAALGWFWYFGSRPDGGRRVLAMLAATSNGTPHVRAAALLAAAVAGRPAACIVHPSPECAAAARRSHDLYTAVGDDHGAAMANTLLAVEGISGHDIDGSLSILTTAEEHLRAAGDDWGQALVHFVRMELHFAAGATFDATHSGRRALAIFRRLDDHWGVSAIQLHLAIALHRSGHLASAQEAYEGALAEGRTIGVANTVQYALAGIGHLTLQDGDLDRAEALFAEAHAIARALGAEGNPLAALGQATAARHGGALDPARELYTWTLHLLTGQHKPDWAATALSGLGHIAELTGRLDTAEFNHRRAWQTAAGPAAAGPAAAALEGLACLACARGQGQRAAELLGAATYWRNTRHRPPSTLETLDINRATQLARAILGDQPYQTAHHTGRTHAEDTVRVLLTGG